MVNPTFCRMFGVTATQVVGKPARTILDADDLADFEGVAASNSVRHGREKEYPRVGLVARKVVFAIPAEGVAAGIFVDLTAEHVQRREMTKLRQEMIVRANEVVRNQMRVAQEIAGLLGETTAETKVTLLQLIDALGENS